MPKPALDDVNLYYESRRVGEPLPLLPGALGRGKEDFQHQIPWFSKQFDIMACRDGANIAVLMAVLQPARTRRLIIWGGNSFLTAEEINACQAIRSISSWSTRAAQAMRKAYGDWLDKLWDEYVTGLEDLYRAGGEIYRSLLPQVRCPPLSLTARRTLLFRLYTLRRSIRESPDLNFTFSQNVSTTSTPDIGKNSTSAPSLSLLKMLMPS
jgi:valacyclovir hydrolase